MIVVVRDRFSAAARDCDVKQSHWLRYIYLAFFSKLAADRRLFRRLRRWQPSRVVQIGLGTAERAERLLDVVARFAPNSVHFTGLDPFEAAGRTSLKDYYRLLQREGVKINLIPGDPHSALARSANVLTETDLLLIGKSANGDSLDAAWFYVPRMLAKGAVVIREIVVSDQETRWEPVAIEDICQWADQQRVLRRAG